MTMKERIARAIMFAGRGRYDMCFDAEEYWDKSSEHWREVALKQAEAVLEAMKEPTEAMVYAGYDSPTVDGAYPAMIDAATEEYRA